ncbi:hypothetical protein ACQ86G_28500 [Roseateles chitinivorans]|uniref:hypothetical protein n=1 Tax=Roseateles chitinivorans TaxID=2917965 RepID=UPI003D669B65
MTTKMYSNEDLRQGRTDFNQFVPVIAHGDSWGSFGSLPTWLTGSLFNALDFGKDVGIVNYAMPGQLLRDLPDPKKFSKFNQAMTARGTPHWRALMISGGGNDLIDWIRRSPGFDLSQRILRRQDEWQDPSQGVARYLSQSGWTHFCEELMDAYVKLDALRDGNFAGMVIITHVYDYMTPRFAPVIGGGSNAWMAPAFEMAGIPKGDWTAVAHVLVDWFHDFLDHQVKARIGGFLVLDTRGGSKPAVPGTTGISNDWANEIHLTAQGYRTLAAAKCNATLTALATTWTTGEIADATTPPAAAALRALESTLQASAGAPPTTAKAMAKSVKQVPDAPAKKLKKPVKTKAAKVTKAAKSTKQPR